MRKFKLFFAFLLMAVLSIGQVWGDNATMSYSAGSTTNMTASGNAATVGLNASLWTVTADKGGQNNYPGLNKNNYIALYAGSNSSQNGASFTVTLGSGTISSITIDYKQNTGTVYVGSSAVTPSNNSYTINNNSFTVKNTLTTGQVQINSISITYSTGSTPSPSITLNPTSLTFDSKEQGATAPGAKTFTITGSNLTGNLSMSASTSSDYYTWTVTSGSLTKNGSNAVSATVTVTPKSSITDEAGSKAGTITISGGGASSQTVSLSMTVTAPAYNYPYTHDFTQISGFDLWGTSYAEHTVNYDIIPSTPDGNNDDQVYFASANHQTSTITNKPVTKGGNVELKLLNNTKYLSAVKFVCQQWSSNTQTITLHYSTDGGTNYSTFNPSITATNFVIENTSLPAKTNAVKISFSKTGNNSQVGISSVSFDLVDKVSYNINKSETGCTLSVTDGTSAITTAEEGDEVYVSIASTETGYENAGFVVKDAENNTIPVTAGKFTMPDKNVTITATAAETDYTVTVNQNPAVSATTTGQTTAAHYNGTINLTTTVPDGYAFVNWTSSDVTITNPTSATTASFTMPAKNVAVTANFVNASKQNPGFAWSANSAEVVKGQTPYSLPTLSANPHSLTPTYVSTNTDVAEISSAGVVNVKAVGSTTIKATYAEDATYAACEASYTLTVKGRVTWHVIKEGIDETTTADYAKDAVPTKPTPASCHSSILLVGWTTSEYAKSDDAPATLYTGNVPAVTDNADYYAVWGVVEEGGWNEITAVASLTAGTYAICSDNYFMKAEKVSGKNRLDNGAVAPVITEGKLGTAPVADCQWTISINAAGKYLFSNGSNYAVATTTKNEMILSSEEGVANTTHAQWEIARADGIFEVTNIGRAGDSDTPANKYLRNNTTSGWACYSRSQGGDGYAPRFFKYSAGSTTGYTTNCVEPMTVVTPVFTPNGSAAYYTSAQDVEISCTTEGSVIYYTLDNTTPSKTNGTQYTTAINVAETKTIKAIAYVGDVASEVATATFTLSLSTMDQIYAAATAIGGTAQERVITFNNWVVSGVGVGSDNNQKTVYVTDGTKGFVIFTEGHGFVANDKISGTVTCQLKLYNKAAQVVGLAKSDITTAGGSVTNDGVITPIAKTIASLGGVNTGAPVIISNVTYNSSNQTLVDGDENAIKPYTTLYNYGSTFVNNKIYSVTGIYLQYGESTKEILPRKTEDIVLESKEQQTITWYVSSAQAEAIGTSYSLDNKDVAFAPVCVSNSTGAKTYQSSNTEVATINENTGVIEVLGNGVTTITCNVVGDENYVDGSKAFTLKVGIGEASWVATTWATDNSIAANAKMADNSPIAIDANISMTWAKAEGSNDPIYHSDGEGRLYQKNTLTFTAANSKQITRIEFHFTGTSTGNIGANEGTYSAGVWEGFAPSVIFTNAQGASGAKIKSIDIEYAQGTTTTLTIADMVILNDASATDIVFSSNKPGAVVTYSDYDEDVITIAEGKVSPVAIGNTSVKASIAAEAPYSSVSITFNVRVKSSTETVENVVILSQFGDKWLAMKHDFTAVEVEKAADGTILDLTCDEADITWVMTADGASAMFQAGTDGYMAVGSSNALTLTEDPTIWTLDNDGYYYKETGRTFLYQGNGGKYKSYAASNHGKSTDGGYSEYATFVTPVFANRAEIRTAGITSGVWGTICPKKEVKYPAGASFFEISYVEYHSNVPYKVFYDEIAEGASLEAGHPYLFQADEESTAIKGITVGDDATSAINDHGFIGVLENETISVVTADVENYRYYIVYNNEIRLCGEGQFLIRAERAYLDMSDPNVEKQYKAPIAGRRRVALTNNAPQVATGMDELNASETPVKVMIDGKFYILRGEKMYDATGKLVK